MSVGRRRAAPILVALGAASSLLAACGGSTSATQGVAAAASKDPVVRLAQKDIHAQLTSNAGYEGPASGPTAKRNQLIVFVAADITNGGIAGVAQGAAQATQALRWSLRILDGQASVRGRRLAMKQALALKPDGIILGGFDATEQREAMKRARADGIPVVGWHAGPRPGPDPADGLFTNVSTDPQAVARLAAHYVIAQSGGTAGVVIFYDSEFHIAVEKAQAMRAEIHKCKGCSVLAMENVAIREAQTRMPALVAALVRKYGTKLTDMLAINGNYFAASGAALLALGISGSAPPFAVAAGDGDASEFARIRSGNYQAASVAEPLYLQGWQLIDEINRALAHQPASHYLAPPRLITKADVPSGGVFDPGTSYQQDYRRLWGG